MSSRAEVRPTGRPTGLLLVAFMTASALVPAAAPALAQDLTETGLGTSWFPTVAAFEAKTGTKLTLSEAPELAAQVAAGTLPALAKRLPADVAVVVPYTEMGQYGGTWHEVTEAPRLDDIGQIVYTDAWLQWDREAKAIRPNLLTDYHFDDDGKTLVLAFRQGVKWSDGEPFTTDDLKYAWDRIITNKEFQTTAGADGQNNSPVLFAHNTDGSFAQLEVVDDHTIKLHYNKPNYGAQYFLPWWNQGYITFHQPKHYLMQFDPMYNKDLKDYSLMTQKDKALENPELPVLWAWRGVSLEPGVRLTMERNPYYWKVDTAGHQLPYIDKVQIDVVQDREVRLLKLVSGEYDASFRGAPDPENLALFREKGPANHVGVKLWGAHGGYPIYQVQQTLAPSEDPYLRKLFQNRDFRCAVSESLDRDHINDVVLEGMGETGQATLPPSDPVFQGEEGQKLFAEWRANCSTYDVDDANKLLDKAGLDKRDAEGFRLKADGTPLTVVIENLPTGIPHLDTDWPMLFKQYVEAVGVRTQWITYTVAQTAVIYDRVHQGVTQITLNDGTDFPFGSTYAFPDYLFPIVGVAPERNWNLIRTYLGTNGAKGEPPEPGSPAEALLKLYDQIVAQPTIAQADKYLRDAIRIHIKDGPFVAGLAGNTPSVVVVKDNFHNVPDYGMIWGWVPQGPAYTDPEQYFISK